ncbi:MAG: MFS transporter [Candidatus Brocadiia bacterium]
MASCCALVATSMAFSLRADIMGDLGWQFKLSEAKLGLAVGPGIWGFTVSIILWSMVIDVLGLGTCLWMAFAGHLIGTSVVIFAQGFASLFIGWLLIGLANGMVEASINPLAATVYADKKTHMLNILHAWWPGGLILGGLMGFGLTKVIGLDSPDIAESTRSIGWKIKMCFVFIPTLIYGGLILGQKFPKTERAAAGVSTGDMFKQVGRPLFLFLLLCMLLTASTELGFNQWVDVLMRKIAGLPGILVLVYTSALMFILRHFAGPLVHRFSPPGLLVTMAVISLIGLLALSQSSTTGAIFLSATVLGIGVAYFWPTMLGTTSELFPKGGALLLGLMGGAGMAIVGWVTVPIMGYIQDQYTLSSLPPKVEAQVVEDRRVNQDKVEELSEEDQQEVKDAQKYAAKNTVLWLAVCPAVLIALFGGFYLHTKKKGGYKQEVLATTGEAVSEGVEAAEAEPPAPEEGPAAPPAEGPEPEAQRPPEPGAQAGPPPSPQGEQPPESEKPEGGEQAPGPDEEEKDQGGGQQA